MSSLVLQAFAGADPNGSALGTLSDATAKILVVQDNAVGSGSFAIHPSSSQIAWCAQGNYVRVRKDSAGGAVLGGFWLEDGYDTVVSPQEQGGKEWRRGGRGPIAILRKAEVWHRSVLSDTSATPQPGRGRWLWPDAYPGKVLIRLLREAQERGTIPAVTWTFSATKDSSGANWSADAKGRWVMPIGSSLLECVGIIREAGFQIDMDADFALSMWEEPHENDLSGTIAFEEGVNIRDVSDRQVQARRAASVALVGGADEDGRMRYEAVRDDDIEDDLGERIEAFIPFERTPKPAAMRRVGLRKLRRWKRQLDGPLTIGVIDTTGQVAIVDYTAGDTVGIDIPDSGLPASDRIVSVTLQETTAGEYDPILKFGDLGHDPISGQDMSGDHAGVAGPPGSGGSGGTTGGGGSTTGGGGTDSGGGGGTPDTDEYEVENWTKGASGTPAEISHITTVSGPGTSHAAFLPNGLDVVSDKRWLLVGYVASDPDAGGALKQQFVDAGMTELESQPSVGGVNSVAVLVQPLDGTQTWDATDNILEFTTAGSDTVKVFAALVDGVSEWTSNSQSGNATPPISGWTGEAELEYVFGFDDAAITGGTDVIESQASGGTAIRVTRAPVTGAQNPPDWTMTGTARWSVTIAGRYADPGWGVTLRGRGVDNDAPWIGGNAWLTTVSAGSATFTTTGTTGVITVTANSTIAQATIISDSLDEEAPSQPWGPWSDAAGVMPIRFKVNRLGVVTDAFDNIVAFEVEGPDYQASFRVHLGDDVSRSYMTTQARGIVILQGATPTASPFVTKTLVADTYYWVRPDFRGTRAKMKIWAGTLADEPVAWDIDVAAIVDTTVGEVGRWHLRVRGGSNTGNLVVTYDTLRGAIGASSGGGTGSVGGQLPRGDGVTTTWTIEPYPPGMLRVWVDGILTKPLSEVPTAGTFTFSRAPAKGAWLTYLVAAPV